MNNGNEKNYLLQGDGRVLGYVRKGVKISRPGEGKTDYRFFHRFRRNFRKPGNGDTGLPDL